MPIEEIIPLVKKAGGIVLVAHPHNKLDVIDRLVELGIDGFEVWHPDLNEAEFSEALRIAMENGLYISGGSDHSGLCGGQYSFYEDYKSCEYYIPECTMGTTKEFFSEMKERRLNPKRNEIIKEYIKYYQEKSE
jgi:isopropylmalate/homocitrate/citramalate synthase